MSETRQTNRTGRAKLALALIAALGGISWAASSYIEFRPARTPGGHLAPAATRLSFIETDDGRQLLWASGPRDIATGEWFDVTDSPLDPDGYQYGIGKDSIPAIDRPAFVAIDAREKLREHGIRDETVVIGYAHNREAKAYPISIMNRHELVNDQVGGKPVTVGW